MTTTELDRAFAASDASDTARLAFYDRLAATELFVMLTEEPVGDNVTPEIFELQDASYVLAFDLEERLSGFADRPVPYAALPGRALVAMLADRRIGIALNLEVAPSQTLLPPEAVQWLAATLSTGPEEGEARPDALTPPRVPEQLITALDARFATAAGLARTAYLAQVTYDDGAKNHLLGLTGTRPEAQPALARAVHEALVFSGLEAGALDVTFLDEDDPLTAELARVALRFDLPEPQAPRRVTIEAPGNDPAKPPKLR